MKNYRDSDYALNKHSEGIVYRFADGRKETVWLKDYLSANPGKTAKDFAALKALSDGIYHEQVVVEHRTGRLDVSSTDMEESDQLSTAALDAELIHKQEERQALKAARQLLAGSNLTEVQKRRFVLHFFKGLSTRQIAHLEGVTQQSVFDSLMWATKKLKKLYGR